MPIQQSHIEPLTHLEMLAKQVVEGFITGLHKSPFHGFSVEFAEHRLYNKGESTRHIDWKLFGRTDKLFVKRYEEETNLRCRIVIDHSSSMYYPESENKNISQLNKIGFSVYAAAALMLLLKKQGDAFGLSLFSDSLELQTQCKSSPTHQKYLFSVLDNLLEEKSAGHKTMAAESLNGISDSIHKRSLVIIFSDMMENTQREDKLFQALNHLKHRKHEVVLFHVTDKSSEMKLELENRPYRFVDLETREEIKLNPSQIRDQYTQAVKNYYEQIKAKCGQYKIDFVEADISLGFDQILLSYMLKRQSMV